MKLSSALDLVSLQPPAGSAAERSLANCHTAGDLRRLAARRLPRPVMDYIDGGADAEHSLAGNTEAFARYRFTPAVLTDVSAPDTRTAILGRAGRPHRWASPPPATPAWSTPPASRRWPAPPRRRSLPYVLSTMATTSRRPWPPNRRETAGSSSMSGRTGPRPSTWSAVRPVGYRVLEVAVDTAVSGNRLRDVATGSPSRRSADRRQPAGHRGQARLLDTPAAGSGPGVRQPVRRPGYTVANIGAQFDPAVTWADLAGLRAAWPGKLLLKGPVGPADAVRARDLGVDGVHLSNHGGRQLDRTVAPVDLVALLRRAVGGTSPSSSTPASATGADVATAVALGADAAMLGRPYLWARPPAARPASRAWPGC